MKKLILFIAVMALMLMPLMAQAGGRHHSKGVDIDIEKNYDEDVYIDIKKDINVEIDAYIKIKGDEGWWCWRYIEVEGLAAAVINDNQVLRDNGVENLENPNVAGATDNAFMNATGNIAANFAAGDNNAQDNLLAAAASKQDLAMADAEIFKVQMSFENGTLNVGKLNEATLSGNAFMNATGNIGVNVVAGNNNAQSNMTAIATAPAKVGIATISVHQESRNNGTRNEPLPYSVEYVPITLTLSGSASSTGFSGNYGGSYLGVQGGSYSGSASGTLSGSVSGMSYQASNFYPDTWAVNPNEPAHDQHPHSPQQIGHNDFDYQTQGAIQNPYRDGVGGLAFDNRNTLDGSYSGTEQGTYGGIEGGIEGGTLGGVVGSQALSGTVSGSIPLITLKKDMVNVAKISGNAFMNATGNIGVNVAAGTGNLQTNALAVTYIRATNGNGGVNGGGEF